MVMSKLANINVTTLYDVEIP
jgi:hypothetical protein